MRKIKFRGKRIDKDEFVYGFYARIQNDDASYTYFIKEDTTIHISNVKQTLYEVIPESIGQFTGLINKDGHELYEFDDCIDSNGWVGTIIYDSDDCQFYFDNMVLGRLDIHINLKIII